MLAVACVPVYAQAVDDFAYTLATPLNGQNGGTGWNGAWNSLTPGLFTITPNLTFPGVVTTGEAVSVGTISSGFAAADRNLANGYRYGGLNSVSDFSYLVRPDASFGQWGAMMIRSSILGTEFGLTTNPQDQTQALYIQQGGAGGTKVLTPVTYTAGTTYLVKAQLVVDNLGNGALTAWLYDNDPNSFAPIASAFKNVGGGWGSYYSLVELYSAGNYTYDQFKVRGDEPIPEAGTMIALGSFLAMGGLFVRRRMAR